jgi:hypothetical protein
MKTPEVKCKVLKLILKIFSSFIYSAQVNFFNFCSQAGAWEPAGNTAVKVIKTRSQALAWECN